MDGWMNREISRAEEFQVIHTLPPTRWNITLSVRCTWRLLSREDGLEREERELVEKADDHYFYHVTKANIKSEAMLRECPLAMV